MVKSYSGLLPVLLVLFFIILGMWMFINPLLNDEAGDYELNYSALLFTAIGLSLTINLKKISFWKEGIQVRQFVTSKETIINISEIAQITIKEDHRNFIERHYSTGRKITGIRIQFKDKNTRDLVLYPYANTSYNEVKDFLHEHYSEFINEQLID